MFVRLTAIAGIIMLSVAAGEARAASTDPLTRLPLYPDMQFANPGSTDVCGTKVDTSTYSANHGNLATIDGWYAVHLHGFKRIHGTSRPYPYDVFVNSDATMSISISGSGPKTAVEAVEYDRNPKPPSANAAQNMMHWLDGSGHSCG